MALNLNIGDVVVVIVSYDRGTDEEALNDADEGRSPNRYRISGKNERGWVWLDLIGPYADSYDGYNADMLVGPTHDGNWELKMSDERCDLMRADEFRLEVTL